MSKSINLDAEDRRVRFLQDLLLRKSGQGAGRTATGTAPLAAPPAAERGPADGFAFASGMSGMSGRDADGADGADLDAAPAAAWDAGRDAGRDAGMAAAGEARDDVGDEDAAEEAGGDADHSRDDPHAGPATVFAPIARIEQVAPNPAAPSAEEAASAAVAAADQARAARRAKQRTRTRLIGFDASSGAAALDPLAGQAAAETGASRSVPFPVGWIVVIDGPGRGECFSLASGLNGIGRDEEQQVRLDFGDDTISRENHASIAFDEESRTCYLGHGGKSNLVRRNGRPVLSTEELDDGDVIRVGETTLKFKALCGADFSWSDRSKVTRLANG